MTPQELKSSILQLAIQGKLVEQRSEEGTGEELYQQIQAEKQRLIKEKKIKKEKTLAEITEGEIPFDIPDSWKWVKLGDCTGYAQTKEKVSPKDITGDMWSLDLEDIQKDTGAILVKTKASERKISGDKVKFHKGQVLYSKLRPYLKKILVAPNEGICTTELVPFDTYLIDENYIAYVLRSPHIDYVINSVTYGVKMPRVGTDTMTNLLIPLPPLAEQKRIVAKIEELLPYVDRYAAAYEKLEQFNAKFPEDMQKSILQMAIQGKLVEQRPEEGTGEELFQQIQAEKQKLSKEGKIKKEKPLPEISEDEIPFEIPESWKWVRMRSLGTFSSGKTPTMGESKYWDNGTISWITSKDMKKKYLNSSEMLITDTATTEMRIYPQNTILMVVRSGILKRQLPVAILTGPSTINQDIKALSLYIPSFAEYVYCILKGMETHILKEYRKQVTTVDSLRFEDFQNMPVPLPPLAEQKRIVAKLEEILPLCEKLKSK